MKINEIIEQDTLFKNCTNIQYEPLNGGLSNETYVVTKDNTKYVVKIHFNQNQYLGLTRQTEIEAQAKAASMGISPQILSDISCQEYSISEFIKGHLITYDEVKQEENIVKLAHTIKKIHSIEGVQRNCSVFDLIDKYAVGIEKFKVQVPEGYYDILKKAETIRAARDKDKTEKDKYCHNDFLNNNILFDEGKICVIDWELSGMGDIYMDLGTLPYQMNFSEEKEKLLLTSYFGYYDEEMSLNLKNLKYAGMVREMLWGFFFEGLNQKSVNHDMDYHGAGNFVYERLHNGFITF